MKALVRETTDHLKASPLTAADWAPELPQPRTSYICTSKRDVLELATLRYLIKHGETYLHHKFFAAYKCMY